MIGVFDSGLGGLGIVAAIRQLSPTADLVVLADQARAPYGDRPTVDVRSFTHEAATDLIGRGCTTVVVACNTASTAALASLRDAHPDLAFVGMEPAVKPAAAHTDSGVIAVLGTTGTIEGDLLASVIDRFGSDRTVMGVALPGLVEMIEDGLAEAPAVERFLERSLEGPKQAGADTYVLACTHYGFARAAIESVVGSAAVIDPAEPVAKQALRVATPARGDGSTTLLTTADPVRMRRQVELILGWDLPVEKVGVGVRPD